MAASGKDDRNCRHDRQKSGGGDLVGRGSRLFLSIFSNVILAGCVFSEEKKYFPVLVSSARCAASSMQAKEHLNFLMSRLRSGRRQIVDISPVLELDRIAQLTQEVAGLHPESMAPVTVFAEAKDCDEGYAVVGTEVRLSGNSKIRQVGVRRSKCGLDPSEVFGPRILRYKHEPSFVLGKEFGLIIGRRRKNFMIFVGLTLWRSSGLDRNLATLLKMFLDQCS